MFKHLLDFIRAWKGLFQPSQERLAFEAELESRSEMSVALWEPLYQAVGRDVTIQIVEFIEKEARWPKGKLQPQDSLDVVFHGQSAEDMPFGRFRADVRRAYGVNLSYRELCSLIPPPHRTVEALVRVVGKMRERKKRQLNGTGS